jgi:hypothetical protein
MIADDTIPVIVPYERSDKPTECRDLLNALQQRQGNPREIMRRLQPYVVPVRSDQLAKLRDPKLAEEAIPGLRVWREAYDDLYGLDLAPYLAKHSGS